MTCRSSFTCRRYSIFIGCLLMLQVGKAQYRFAELDSWLKSNLQDIGDRAVLMIYQDGKVVYSKAENDLGRKQKFIGKIIARKTGKDEQVVLQDYSENSRISIASCSKWLSAALIMTFADEGKLNVNDNIGKFLTVMSRYGKGKITIAQCLSHMTGISASQKEDRELISDAADMDAVMEEIAKKPLESEPGTSFHYSSTGLQIAAGVIEKISGQSFENLFAERIAKPCGMINTDFGHKKVPLAAGGASGTPIDYLHFLQMILEHGSYNGRIVLKKGSIEMMQQNYVAGKKIAYSPAEAMNWGYGFGEWVMGDAQNNTTSDAVSSPGLFGSFPWIDNKNRYAAVLFTFYLKNKGRNERYLQLKKIIDNILK